MSKPKYLKLIAVVEDNYVPISGKITTEEGSWHSENVMTVKLDDNFAPIIGTELLESRFLEFAAGVLRMVREKSNE